MFGNLFTDTFLWDPHIDFSRRGELILIAVLVRTLSLNLASAVHSCPDTACPMVASSEQACLSSASSCCSPSTKPDQDHQPLHLRFFPIDSSSNSTTSSLSHPDRQSTRVSCTQIKSDSTPSLIQALSFQSLLLSSS